MSTGDLNFAIRHGRCGGRAVQSVASLAPDHGSRCKSASIVIAALMAAAILMSPRSVGMALAQAPGVLAPGNAVVTGFSGAPLPAQVAPGVDPGDQTFIDPNGP